MFEDATLVYGACFVTRKNDGRIGVDADLTKGDEEECFKFKCTFLRGSN